VFDHVHRRGPHRRITVDEGGDGQVEREPPGALGGGVTDNSMTLNLGVTESDGPIVFGVGRRRQVQGDRQIAWSVPGPAQDSGTRIEPATATCRRRIPGNGPRA
jgi:hypothetical protein